MFVFQLGQSYLELHKHGANSITTTGNEPAVQYPPGGAVSPGVQHSAAAGAATLPLPVPRHP